MQAKTSIEIGKCFDWLCDKKAIPLTDLFFYKEKDGDLIAVAGVIHSIGNKSFFIQIEPMMSESKRASLELYNEIMDYAESVGCKFVLAGSSNEKVHKNLEKLGWRKWNEEVTHYIKDTKCLVEQQNQS